MELASGIGVASVTLVTSEPSDTWCCRVFGRRQDGRKGSGAKQRLTIREYLLPPPSIVREIKPEHPRRFPRTLLRVCSARVRVEPGDGAVRMGLDARLGEGLARKRAPRHEASDRLFRNAKQARNQVRGWGFSPDDRLMTELASLRPPTRRPHGGGTSARSPSTAGFSP